MKRRLFDFQEDQEDWKEKLNENLIDEPDYWENVYSAYPRKKQDFLTEQEYVESIRKEMKTNKKSKKSKDKSEKEFKKLFKKKKRKKEKEEKNEEFNSIQFELIKTRFDQLKQKSSIKKNDIPIPCIDSIEINGKAINDYLKLSLLNNDSRKKVIKDLLRIYHPDKFLQSFESIMKNEKEKIEIMNLIDSIVKSLNDLLND